MTMKKDNRTLYFLQFVMSFIYFPSDLVQNISNLIFLLLNLYRSIIKNIEITL
jgi:hypothetical protein